MAICKSGWLYFERSELPLWAKDGEYARLYQKDEDWIITYCELPRDTPDYQKWNKRRILARQMKAGTYEVLPHSPFAVFLRFISEDTTRKHAPHTDTQSGEETKAEQPKNDIPPEPELNPETCNAKDARQWLIWREYLLLKVGKVPQGWASVADAFLDRVKERDTQNKKDAEKRALTDGSKPKVEKSEREMLMEIISAPTTNARDKMAAQARLNEMDAAENKAADGIYAPEPIIKEI